MTSEGVNRRLQLGQWETDGEFSVFLIVYYLQKEFKTEKCIYNPWPRNFTPKNVHCGFTV